MRRRSRSSADAGGKGASVGELATAAAVPAATAEVLSEFAQRAKADKKICVLCTPAHGSSAAQGDNGMANGEDDAQRQLTDWQQRLSETERAAR
jgi:hypothetical protein